MKPRVRRKHKQLLGTNMVMDAILEVMQLAQEVIPTNVSVQIKKDNAIPEDGGALIKRVAKLMLRIRTKHLLSKHGRGWRRNS